MAHRPDHAEFSHDRLGPGFEDLLNEYDTQRRLEVLIEEFLTRKDLDHMLALDAGCGSGRGSVGLRQTGARVVACDLGYGLARYTHQRSLTATLTGSILELPFRDGTFNIVLSSEAIEHTPDPIAAVKELYRVVAPAGHLVLSTPNRLWQLPVRAASALELRPYAALENFLWPTELRRALLKLGAKVVEHRGIHLLPFQLRTIHRFLRWADRYGQTLLPLMINQCIHCVKPL